MTISPHSRKKISRKKLIWKAKEKNGKEKFIYSSDGMWMCIIKKLWGEVGVGNEGKKQAKKFSFWYKKSRKFEEYIKMWYFLVKLLIVFHRTLGGMREIYFFLIYSWNNLEFAFDDIILLAFDSNSFKHIKIFHLIKEIPELIVCRIKFLRDI